MRHLHLSIFLLVASCATPPESTQGGYTVTAFREDGTVSQVWHTASIHRPEIGVVEFTDSGKVIRVDGSFLVESNLKK